MTRAKLKQYKYLKIEAENLRSKLNECACSTVRYDSDGIHSSGGNISDMIAYLAAKKEPIAEQYRAKLEEINEWVLNIDDSLVRQAIRMYYIDGCGNWNYVSTKLTKNVVDGKVLSNMCNRYIKKSEEENTKKEQAE